MIFRRALLKEFAGVAGAVFLALTSISLTVRLVRLLGQAAGGKIPTDVVFAFLGFFTVSTLPVLLSLTLFVAILTTLTRSYRDSEMVVWFSSGLSLTAWLRPVLTFALPIVLVVATLTFVISPWASKKAEEFDARIQARDDVARVNAGVFGESSGGDRVFFVESVSGDRNAVQNVFVDSVQHQRDGVMVSASGRTETAKTGDRFLVLENGRRYDGRAGEADFRVMEFDRYAARIETKESAPGDDSYRNMSSVPTLDLIGSSIAAYRGELVWRVGIPLSALLLALLAIPMSFVNPRAGRSANLLLALLAYMVYSNLLSISQARVAQGSMSFATGWWIVHGAMLALLLLLFVLRTRLVRLRFF
jgi:lipopolysaccharide export system permease protein